MTQLRVAVFRNSKASYGGAAYYCQGRIVVCIGHASRFPTCSRTHRNGHKQSLADRLEALVWVTAHEAAHVLQRRVRTRQSGSGGGSEIATEWLATPVVEQFRKMRDSLLEQWNAAPAVALRAPQPNAVERRAVKARLDLERWQRKLKLAQTKVRKLKTRVRYYERCASTQCSPPATPPTTAVKAAP